MYPKGPRSLAVAYVPNSASKSLGGTTPFKMLTLTKIEPLSSKLHTHTQQRQQQQHTHHNAGDHLRLMMKLFVLKNVLKSAVS